MINIVFCGAYLAKLYPVDKDEYRIDKITKYKERVKKLNLTNLEFPMHISNVPKFEKQNGLNINVFEMQSNTMYQSPIYINDQLFRIVK